MPVWTPAGYRNLELDALQTYINAPLLELIAAGGGGAAKPSVWPAARTIALTGPVTGSVAMDGSANGTIATAIANNALSIAQVANLQTTLNTVTGRLDGHDTSVSNLQTSKQDRYNYTPVSLDATNLGRTAGTAPVGWAQAIADNWRVLPTGYVGFIDISVGITGGGPVNSYGHFFKMGRRDQLNGWAGLWIDHTSPAMWVGSTADGANFATWARVWTNLNFDPATKQDKLAGAAASVVLGNGTSRPVSDFAMTNTTGVFTEVVAQSTIDHWVILGRRDVNTPLGGLWLDGTATPANSNVALVNAANGQWSALLVSSTGIPYFQTGGVSQVLWHAGNFNPASYSTTSHNHSGVYAPAVHTHPAESTVASRLTIPDLRAAPRPPGGVGYDNTVSFGFNTGQNLGLTTNHFFTTMILNPCNDDSGGVSFQLAINGTAGAGISYRNGTRAANWAANWYTLWDTSNLDPAAPVKSTGIFTIGDPAGTRTRFNNLAQLSWNGGAWASIWTTSNLNPGDYFKSVQSPSVYENPNLGDATFKSFVTGGDAMGGPGTYATVYNFGMSANRSFQIASTYSTVSDFWIRGQNDGSGWSKPWCRLWTSVNFDPASKLNARGSLGIDAVTINDWNAADSNGWFMAADAANKPLDGWLMGIVTRHNSEWIQQEVWAFTDTAGTRRFRRHKMGGTWGAWTNSAMFWDLNVNTVNCGYDPAASNSIGCSNWFRSIGATGLFFASYGSGLYSDEAGWIKAYNGSRMAAATFKATAAASPHAGSSYASYVATGQYGGGFGCVDGGSGAAFYMGGGHAYIGVGSPTQHMNVWRFGNNGSFYAYEVELTSDISLKRDIEVLEFRGPLAPVTYSWIDETKPQEQQIGFISQWVEETYPELVSEADGIKHIKYAKVAAVLAAQNNAQQHQIDAQQHQIDTLTEQLAAVLKHLQL